MHVTFDYPAVLLLLLLIPCFHYCRKKRDVRFLPKLTWILPKRRWINRTLLFRVTIFALLVFALASPFSYSAKYPAEREGVAIVLALDTSGSMRESGFSKQGNESKFALLQKLAKAFILGRGGDNIGIVAFGSYAFTASPVSYDLEGVAELLSMLEVEIAGKNTAIGEAIMQSIRTLEAAKAKEKVIVLVTDGKNNSGAVSVKEAVAAAKQKGIKIYTIGLGKRGDYDAFLLQKVAQESGGKAFDARDVDDLRNVYAQIDRLLPSPLRSAGYLDREMLFMYPLAAAVLLLFGYLYRRSDV